MTNYGYINVPATTPEHYVQHYGILAFAANHGLGLVHFINESAAPPVPETSPVLAGMVAELLPRDKLIAMNFSTLGSTPMEILNVLSTLSRRGVRVYVVNSGFRLDDNTEAQVVGAACTLIARIDAEFASKCPNLKSAQEPPADGEPPQLPRRTRKSRLDGKEEEIRAMLRDGASLSQIAKMVGQNRQTTADYIASRQLAP